MSPSFNGSDGCVCGACGLRVHSNWCAPCSGFHGKDVVFSALKPATSNLCFYDAWYLPDAVG